MVNKIELKYFTSELRKAINTIDNQINICSQFNIFSKELNDVIFKLNMDVYKAIIANEDEYYEIEIDPWDTLEKIGKVLVHTSDMDDYFDQVKILKDFLNKND